MLDRKQTVFIQSEHVEARKHAISFFRKLADPSCVFGCQIKRFIIPVRQFDPRIEHRFQIRAFQIKHFLQDA